MVAVVSKKHGTTSRTKQGKVSVGREVDAERLEQARKRSGQALKDRAKEAKQRESSMVCGSQRWLGTPRKAKYGQKSMR